MDTNSKLVQFLQRLRKATEAGKVHWEETIDEDAFRVVLDHGMVRVGLGRDADEDGEENQYHYAALMDASGRRVGEISDIDTDPQLLPDLYTLARRDARNIDAILDDLMADLESKGSR